MIRFILILAGLVIGVGLIIKFSGGPTGKTPTVEPVTDSLVTEAYPELYRAIFSREADQVRPFLDHTSEEVRRQAWRALANTPVEHKDVYLKLAREADLEAAWFFLEMHDFSGPELRELESWWIQNEEIRPGIARVLGRQGDRQTLEFLLSRDLVTSSEDTPDAPYEYEFALAIGRLMTRFEVRESSLLSLVNRAFEVDNLDITRAYLYGLYRGDVQSVSKKVKDAIYTQWNFYVMGNDEDVDQYVARILKERAFHSLVMYYNSEKLMESNVQLAIELAGILEGITLDDEVKLPVRILLSHSNPHVVAQTFRSLRGKLEPGDRLFTYIRENILEAPATEPMVWVQALTTLGTADTTVISEYRDQLRTVGREYTYLLPEVLNAIRLITSPGEYLDILREIISEGDQLRVLFAVRALDSFSNEQEPRNQTDIRTDIREIVFKALQMHDRGVAFALEGLLSDNRLFDDNDFEDINGILGTFTLPADIEVFQAFGRIYKENFEDRAATVVDSLAGLGYPALNRSLAATGWDVEVPEAGGVSFRQPDWNRVWELGYHPVWVLVTEKGNIKVRMNTLSAPATIAAIDSLTQSGVYNGVPFHRVVPNFVIQGGDIERADGFGGPDFIIPTEGVETEFNRGAAGIASAGTDTEGSQYFIMHQWKPHLNGRYTRFGEVIEGMQVVDRIVVGDTVRTVYWE